MKKMFGRNNRIKSEWDNYDENDFSWDEVDEADGVEAYYGESAEDDGFYGADGALDEGDGYYTASEELDEGDGYYTADEELDEGDGYYTAGEELDEGDRYYTAGEELDGGDGYYVTGEEIDGYGEYYAEDEGYYAEQEYDIEEAGRTEALSMGKIGKNSPGSRPAERHTGKKIGFMGKIRRGISRMELMDRLILGTGVTVLILALITGGVYISTRNKGTQVSSFADVGNQLDGIDVIGGSGLLAVADAQLAKREAADAVDENQQIPDEDKNEGYQEGDYKREIQVAMEFVSIQKDLKIKFVNEKTNKLVANVPFSVNITDPDGNKFIWSDDDMDGIIYKKDIKPGSYKVVMESLSDERYSSYSISTLTRTVNVKKNIAYEKVEVANEIKSEDEVNAGKEDTAKNETTVESVLQDTVAWVESKVIEGAYVPVDKKTIKDPIEEELKKATATQASAGRGVAVTSETVKTLSENDQSTVPSPTTPPPTSPSPSPEAPTTPPPSESPTPTPTPTETLEPLIIKLEPNQVTTTVNGAVTSQVTIVAPSPLPSGKTVEYFFANDSKSLSNDYLQATIDDTGKITITGKAVISSTPVQVVAKYAGNNEKSNTAILNVSVNPAKTITLDKSPLITFVGETLDLNATVSDSVTPVLELKSSDETVATVSVKQTAVGKATISVLGRKAGTSVITVNLVEGSSTSKVIAATATFTVTIKEHPRNDQVTKLKDTSGKQMYVEVAGNEKKYREATYADFYVDGVKFYTLTEAKYTGWQTLGGKVYYFTADGKYVTGEQVIQGAKYTFASDGTLVTGNGMLGIDVSKWNGNIDWNAVKNSGVNYVIIRCGYRGSSAGSLIEDPKFKSNIQGASAAGLKVGVYFFTQAMDEREAVEEASMVLELIKNYKISYPVFLDVESSGGRADVIDKATRTAVCKAFCQTIQSKGYTAGIYANKNWLENKLDPSALSAYKIWLAQYASTPTYTGRYDLWQYRSTGRVSGISGDVDMNLSYLGY